MHKMHYKKNTLMMYFIVFWLPTCFGQIQGGFFEKQEYNYN
jgi:hypothetical protein